MNVRRIALRGILGLAIAVALCMFFAGTIRTMTTAKVELVTATTGRLGQIIKLKGKLKFPETEPYRFPNASKFNMRVTQVNVRLGYAVKQGDLLFTAELTDYEDKLAELQDQYAAELHALNKLDITNISFKKDSKVFSRYQDLFDKQQTLADAKMQATLIAAEQGYEPGDLSMRTSAGAEYSKAIADLDKAQAAFEEARLTLIGSIRKGDGKGGDKDKTAENDQKLFAYVSDRLISMNKLSDLELKMAELERMQKELIQIRAPHAGYIAALNVEEGEIYDGAMPAYELSAANSTPVLRADITDAEQPISEGMQAELGAEGHGVKASVLRIGFTVEGDKYCDIQLDEPSIAQMGGVYALWADPTDIRVSYQAEHITTLIPASALRTGDEDYVYEVNSQPGAVSGDTLVVKRRSVTVLGRSDDTVSISELMTDVQLVQHEDRAIGDGDAVMEYLD